MPRSDSSLYTGSSSASVAHKRVVKHEEKAEKRLKLLPSGDIVNDEFRKEIDLLKYAPYINEDTMSDAQFRIERRSRYIAIERLSVIQNRLNNLLRETK